jgi:hypothetical protein
MTTAADIIEDYQIQCILSWNELPRFPLDRGKMLFGILLSASLEIIVLAMLEMYGISAGVDLYSVTSVAYKRQCWLLCCCCCTWFLTVTHQDSAFPCVFKRRQYGDSGRIGPQHTHNLNITKLDLLCEHRTVAHRSSGWSQEQYHSQKVFWSRSKFYTDSLYMPYRVMPVVVHWRTTNQ